MCVCEREREALQSNYKFLSRNEEQRQNGCTKYDKWQKIAVRPPLLCLYFGPFKMCVSLASGNHKMPKIEQHSQAFLATRLIVYIDHLPFCLSSFHSLSITKVVPFSLYRFFCSVYYLSLSLLVNISITIYSLFLPFLSLPTYIISLSI